MLSRVEMSYLFSLWSICWFNSTYQGSPSTYIECACPCYISPKPGNLRAGRSGSNFSYSISTLRESNEIMWELASTSMIMYVYVESYIRYMNIYDVYHIHIHTLYIYIYREREREILETPKAEVICLSIFLIFGMGKWDFFRTKFWIFLGKAWWNSCKMPWAYETSQNLFIASFCHQKSFFSPPNSGAHDMPLVDVWHAAEPGKDETLRCCHRKCSSQMPGNDIETTWMVSVPNSSRCWICCYLLLV